MNQQDDRLPRMRQTYWEIVESDRGESELMSDYRWACDEITRLRALLQDIRDYDMIDPRGYSTEELIEMDQAIDRRIAEALQALE